MRKSLMVIILIFSFSLLRAYAEDADDAKLGHIVEEVYSSEVYQTSLPGIVISNGNSVVRELPANKAHKPAPQEKKAEKQTNVKIYPSSPFSSALIIIVAVVLSALTVVLAVSLTGFIPLRRADDSLEEFHDEITDDLEDKTSDVLRQVAELAAENKIKEAIHLLFYKILEEIRFQIDPTVTDSFTSKEIIRKAKMVREAKVQFKTIADFIEKIFFGNKDGTMVMLDQCVSAYKIFYEACYGRK